MVEINSEHRKVSICAWCDTECIRLILIHFAGFGVASSQLLDQSRWSNSDADKKHQTELPRISVPQNVFDKEELQTR